MNYINLEVMSATSKVAEALKARGFFAEEENGAIEFTKSSAQGDQTQALHLLNHLEIPFMLMPDQSVEILVNKLPNSVFKKIFQFGGAPFEVSFYAHQANWRYFTSKRFGIRVEALDLEYNMARFVKMANLAGIATFAGCNGHLKNSPRFQFYGMFHGAWFNAIQQTYMGDLQLNYRWEVMFQGPTQAELRVVDEKGWDQNLIHQDTLKMAEVLEKHAVEIRELKEKVFSKHQSMPKIFFRHEQHKELASWMIEQLMNTRDFPNQLKKVDLFFKID